jgi:hypothetical protein
MLSLPTRFFRFSAAFQWAFVVLFFALCVLSPRANAETPSSVLHTSKDFEMRDMLRPGPGQTRATTSFTVDQPSRFSMQQSYSLSAMSGPGGSMSSGLYLNTLSYQLSAPLTFSVDVGFHTPIHSTVAGLDAEAGGAGSIVLPRMGLEYRPSDRLTMNLELVNLPDAWKAYGGMPWYSSSHLGSRIP